MHDKVQHLREKAEKVLQKSMDLKTDIPIGDFSNIIHELKVYQIELEIQNEELRNTQHHLEDSRNLFAQLYNNAPAGYVTLDSKSFIVQANQTFADMVNADLSKITNNVFSEFIDVEERSLFHGRFNAFFKHPEGKVIETTLMKKGGKSTIVNISGKLDTNYPLSFKPDKKTPLLLLIISDISQQKKLENEILNREMMLKKHIAEKDKLFSIIAHDLKGPFNSFLGLTQIMANDLPKLTMNEIQDISARLEKSANKLYSYLDNVLTWARIQRGMIQFRPDSVLLSKVVNDNIEVFNEMIGNKSIIVKTDIPAGLTVFADIHGLDIVIKNLLSNAIKFSYINGVVTIKAQKTNNSLIQMSISDNGLGMSKELLENLFLNEKSTTREGTNHEPGNGLGLMLFKEFTENMGGSFTIESQEGVGSKFTVLLPQG